MGGELHNASPHNHNVVKQYSAALTCHSSSDTSPSDKGRGVAFAITSSSSSLYMISTWELILIGHDQEYIDLLVMNCDFGEHPSKWKWNEITTRLDSLVRLEYSDSTLILISM